MFSLRHTVAKSGEEPPTTAKSVQSTTLYERMRQSLAKGKALKPPPPPSGRPQRAAPLLPTVRDGVSRHNPFVVNDDEQNDRGAA